MRNSFAVVVGAAFALSVAVGAAGELRFSVVANEPGEKAAVELRGLDEAQIAAIGKADGWPVAFEVRVADSAADSPSVAGTVAVDGEVVRFTPRFAFQPRVTYVATLHAPAAVNLQPLSLAWTVPAEKASEATTVRAVYPSADLLPENQLKFYLHFTAPMSRGEAYEHVRLLRIGGDAVDLPFLEIGEELWDRSGKRLTLLIDPGRIKQGVKPREDIGPALEAGGRYTLQIDPAWKDATGRPLAQGFEKSFVVGPPVAGALNTKDWQFELPGVGTKQSLKVRFPKPLDHALLQRTIWIESAEGEIEGRAETVDREFGWTFTPKEHWTHAEHWLVVDTVLEDLGGNRIGSAFEVDALDPLQKRIEQKTVRLPLSLPAKRP